MINVMTSVEYIFHDCFVVRTPSAVLVFDFWKRPRSLGDNFVGESPLSPDDLAKPVYIFVSHFHKDHYNRHIFEWIREIPNIHFILSKDTARHARHILRLDSLYAGVKPDPRQVTVISEGEEWHDGVVGVHAFGSTDCGNSYAVEVDGLKIFHAGDLNAWIWIDESTPQEVKKATSDYLVILRKIKESFDSFDIAMFPVDSRIGTDYCRGARLFLENFKVDRFFPMHFELGESHTDVERLHADALRLSDYINPDSPREVVGLTSPGALCFWE